MAYTYNLTNVTAANATMELIQATNEISGDWWARLFLIGLFFLITISIALKTGEGLKGSVAAGFVTTLVSYLFWVANLTSMVEPLLTTVTTGLLILALYYGGLPK